MGPNATSLHESHASNVSEGRITGMRWWSGRIATLAAVVRTVDVSTASAGGANWRTWPGLGAGRGSDAARIIREKTTERGLGL